MALTYAPDGRIAYGVKHVYSPKHTKIDVQRDDIWVLDTDGKRRKIVNGERLVQGNQAFSYAIQSIRWSPDGTRLTVELLTEQFVDERGTTQEGQGTLMLDENGKEIKVVKGDSVIPNSFHATWLGDNATVAYLLEAAKPMLLFHVGLTRPAEGYGGVIFFEHTFSAAAWDAKHSTAVAVERNASLSGPPRLVALDLAKESLREIAKLDAFAGGLALSPSGTKAAYFRDPEVIEFRDLIHPELVARIRVSFGTFQWTADEQRLLLKRGAERKSADLVWVQVPRLVSELPSAAVPAAEVQPALHGLTFRDFELSPDGRHIAVIEPGKRNLQIYPAQ